MIDDQLRVAAVVIVALIGVGITGQYLLGGTLGQPFSEVGILGPGGQFAEYPTSMSIGTNYTIKLFVANHEGHSMLYQVYEKLGSKATPINQTSPLSSTPVASYGFALPDNGTAVRPISVRLDSPGLNVRIVWELWDYVPASNSWTYDGSWAQLYVNATV